MKTYSAEIITPFRIKKRPTRWGAFWANRLLFDFYGEGGKAWQGGLLMAIQMLLMLPMLLLDFGILLVWGIGLLLFGFGKKTIETGNDITKETIKTAFRFILKWGIAIGAIIFLYTIISDGSWTEYSEKLSSFLEQLQSDLF